MIFFTVFTSFIVIDFAYARWAQACAQEKIAPAAFWAAIIPVFTGYSAIQFVADPVMLIPAALGGAVGTVLGMLK